MPVRPLGTCMSTDSMEAEGDFLVSPFADFLLLAIGTILVAAATGVFLLL